MVFPTSGDEKMRLPQACQASKYLQAKRWSGSFSFLATLYENLNGSFEIRCVKWREGTDSMPCKREEYEGFADWEPIN